jgi:hypothetical protein
MNRPAKVLELEVQVSRLAEAVRSERILNSQKFEQLESELARVTGSAAITIMPATGRGPHYPSAA